MTRLFGLKAMGCSSSSAKLQEHQARFSTASFLSAGTVWSGCPAVGGVVRATHSSGNDSTIQTAEGTLQVKKKRKTVSCSDETGVTVFLVYRESVGNFFTCTPSTWSVWAAKGAREGQEPEEAPSGDKLFRRGKFTLKPTDAPLDVFDDQGSLMLRVKIISYSACVIFGPDGTSPAATVEDMMSGSGAKFCGTVTCAVGIDSLLALAAANAALSMQ